MNAEGNKFMRPISLNDYLSKDNVWTKRLFGIETFQQQRSMNLIEREYNRDMYGKIFAKFRGNIDALQDMVLHGTNEQVVVSIKDEIVAMPKSIFLAIKRHYMSKTLGIYSKSNSLCELGAGYGQNFLWLAKAINRSFYGGEYSVNAVSLAKLLGFEIYPFNFYDSTTYEFIKPGTTLFTSHAVEQITEAQVFINSLKKIRNRINCVIHFEPLFRKDRDNLIGLLRNKYIQINGYNQNLLQLLKKDSEIKIIYLETDVFGLNPLNSTSILVWKFY